MNFTDLQLLDLLIQRAMKDEASPFKLIESSTEYKAVLVFKRAVLKTSVKFKNLQDRLYKAYLNSLNQGKRDTSLLTYSIQMKLCKEFYEREWYVADYMSREFISYACSGHLLDVLFNCGRAEEDMWDHLNPPKIKN